MSDATLKDLVTWAMDTLMIPLEINALAADPRCAEDKSRYRRNNQAAKAELQAILAEIQHAIASGQISPSNRLQELCKRVLRRATQVLNDGYTAYQRSPALNPASPPPGKEPA